MLLHRTRLLIAPALFALLATSTPAPAETPSDVWQLDTACIMVREPFSNATGPSEMTGSGAFDAFAAAMPLADGSQRIFVAYDDTGQWRRNSGIVPRYAVVDLTKDGLAIHKKDQWLGSALFDSTSSPPSTRRGSGSSASSSGASWSARSASMGAA